MTRVKVSKQEFIDTWNKYGSPTEVAGVLGLTIRSVLERRNRLQREGVADLVTRPKPGSHKIYTRTQTFDRRREITVPNGTVVVYSDAHFWPGDPSLAYMGLLELIRELRPKAIIANGDLLDGAKISRHEPRGWHHRPSVRDEVAVLTERQDEIRKAAPAGCKLFRTLGNHDVRFERYLAIHAPEIEGLKGTALEDFIPDWPCSWSVAINGNTLVKHRWKGGIHATYRNTVEAGWNMVTGHLHSMRVTPFTDLHDEIRYGVDAGCLADIDHDAFDYVEDNPVNWRSGFVVLTYRNGRMLWPDFCYRFKNEILFRGEVVL